MSALRIVALFVASLLASATTARASESDGQVDSATEDLIQQGIALRRSGKDEAALAVFLDAEKRAPNSARVLLHITTAAQGSGKWLMAHEYLQKAAAFRNEPYYQRYRSSIRAIDETVAQHVGQFRAIGTPAGASVLLNGEVVGTLPMERPIIREVGSYQLEVSRPGFFPLRRPVNVAGGGGLSTEAVELKPSFNVPDSVVMGRARTGDLAARDVPGDGDASHSRRWLTWTMAAGSLVLLGTSGVMFGIVRERDVAKWNDDDVCLSREQPTMTRESICGDVRRSANTAQTVGIVTGALGIAVGAAALAHWLATSPSSPATSEGHDQARHVPSCAAGFGGIGCWGTF